MHDRQVYSMFDILSDVGGLFTALKAISQFIIMFGQYRGDHMFMMRDMFNSQGKSFKQMSELEKEQT